MARSEESIRREKERLRRSEQLRQRREQRRILAEERIKYREKRRLQLEQYLADLPRQRSERKRQWWASLTPEQRAEVRAKIRAGWRKPPRVRPGKKCGEDHHGSKLTEATVRKIHADMRLAREVSEDFGISIAIIRKIWAGKSWRHLGLPVLERPDHRRRATVKKPKPVAPPSLTDEQKAEIIASPFEDTRSLAERLGVHWMFIATFRQKRLKKGSR